METTLKNLDDQAFEAIRSRAAAEGRPVEDLVDDALRLYIRRLMPRARTRSLEELRPERYPEGNENLSKEIDEVVYGARS
jgi:plasmid stability protein